MAEILSAPTSYHPTESLPLRQDRVIQALREFSNLGFGPLSLSQAGWKVSNDVGFPELVPQIRKRGKETADGIGVVIGGGSFLSILPEIQTDALLIVDHDPDVILFNQRLLDSVKKSSSPREAVVRLVNDPSTLTSPGEIDEELKRYGPYHWKNDQRFPIIKQALGRVPILFMAADITHPEFGPALSQALDEVQAEISFAQMTNVHNWIGEELTREICDVWPFKENALILFGSMVKKKQLKSEYPHMEIASGAEDYLELSSRDATRYM